MSIHAMVRLVEKQNPSIVGTASWNGLKNFVAVEFPVLTPIHVHSVYKMVSKGLTRRIVVTKENSKTWVMYEVEDSARPGMRWMIGKTWCIKDNIWHDTTQSYTLPVGLKLK